MEIGFPLRYAARGGGGSADCLAFLPGFNRCPEKSGFQFVRLLGYLLHSWSAIAANYRRFPATGGDTLYCHKRGGPLVKDPAAFALYPTHYCRFDTGAAFRRSPVLVVS